MRYERVLCCRSRYPPEARSGAPLAVVSGANLRRAMMRAAYLAHATLTGADLRGANLIAAVFHQTTLRGADLAGAKLCHTIFADCPTLHLAKGLAQVEHAGPSSPYQCTLRACAADLPDVFLRGVGYTDAEIAALRRPTA